ncbi:MAG: glycosyltransferase family 39 protein [Deltaproteobacteria bacterium]|nr:glycosyltransferase family 39 protein [Deltaproteobacteria bacterium]
MRRFLISFFFIFFSLQIFVAIQTGEFNSPPPKGDALDYDNIAWNLTNGHGFGINFGDKDWQQSYLNSDLSEKYLSIFNTEASFSPTAYRPPLLPILISIFYRVFGVKFWIWQIFSTIISAMAFSAACYIAYKSFGKRAAEITALAACADIVFGLYLFNHYLTERLTLLLLVSLFILLSSGHKYSAISSGFVLGLLCLTRSIFIVWLPLIPLYILYSAETKRSKSALFCLGCALITISPWVIRNISLIGASFPFGTQAASNLPVSYSDHALKYDGVWSGRYKRELFLPYQDELLEKQGIDREVETAKIGKHLFLEWLPSNFMKIPDLIFERIYSLWWRHTYAFQKMLIVLSIVGLLLATGEFRRIAVLFLLMNTIAVGLTWALYQGRMLIPMHFIFYMASGIALNSLVKMLYLDRSVSKTERA